MNGAGFVIAPPSLGDALRTPPSEAAELREPARVFESLQADVVPPPPDFSAGDFNADDFKT